MCDHKGRGGEDASFPAGRSGAFAPFDGGPGWSSGFALDQGLAEWHPVGCSSKVSDSSDLSALSDSSDIGTLTSVAPPESPHHKNSQQGES